jgi:hypothetical protein
MHAAFAAVSLAAAVGAYAGLAQLRADRGPAAFLLGLLAGALLTIALTA